MSPLRFFHPGLFATAIALCALVFGGLHAPSPAFGQSTNGGVLTIESAMEAAAQNNELALLAQQEVRRREAEAGLARDRLLPFGELAGTLTRNDTQIQLGDRAFTNLWDYSARANLVVPLLRIDEWTARRALQTSTESAQSLARWEASNLRVSAGRAYLAALTAQQNLAVADEQIGLAQTSLEQSTALAEAGFLVDADVAQAELQLLQAQNNVVRAQLEHRNALASLAFIMGVPEDEVMSAELDAPTLPAADPAQPLASEQAQRVALQSAQQLLRSVRQDWLPTLNLVGQYNFQRASLRAPNGTFWTISLNLNWVFLDFTRRGRREVAQTQVQTAEIQADRLARSNEFQRAQAHRTLESTEIQVQTAAQQIEAAEIAQNLVRERFSAGEVTVLEMTQADTAVFTARIAHHLAQLNRDLAQLDLLFFSGALDDESPGVTE
jgi:outer membrane protein TolC